LRSPPPSGNGSGFGAGTPNGCAICCAASIDPAPPGRIEWVLLQTSKFQSEILPLPSSDAFSFVTIAGPNGSQACSCSRIHCTRTGVPGKARASRAASAAASSAPLWP
jgi:hypothetical protein